MIPKELEPNIDLLRQEYVLVQAWKKTASFIRYHNWFSDTLDLDWQAINLRSFIGKISEQLASPESWENRELKLVQAPKIFPWHRNKKGNWKPDYKRVKNSGPQNKLTLRPLAHVDLQDQVVATAILLCLGNRVETAQGDPTLDIHDRTSLRKITSYGNRLFCDNQGGRLLHRWGSAKLYRSYFADYRNFISRPDAVGKRVQLDSRQHVYIVSADLSRFYDRVRPSLLTTALQTIQLKNDDSAFFVFANKFFNWTWSENDSKDATEYANSANIENFNEIALPQGLVAAGSFANVVLLEFDRQLRRQIGEKIVQNLYLDDVCRYVDDLRLVVSSDRNDCTPTNVGENIVSWLNRNLKLTSSDLSFNPEKVEVIKIGSHERPRIRQHARMARIQSAVSGGFDMDTGTEILDSIQTLSQNALRNTPTDPDTQFTPLPDVRNETVLRFAAARFRTTYRNIRPLFDSEDDIDPNDVSRSTQLGIRDREILDNDARTYALILIDRWMHDPSNVRLLRIGLDIYPDAETLQEILQFMKPYSIGKKRKTLERKVVWYCLSELFRAGATETGLVEDSDSLPNGICLDDYREILGKEGVRLIELGLGVPWYLQQQILLFLAAWNPSAIKPKLLNSIRHSKRHTIALKFLRKSAVRLSSSDYATVSVLARRSFLNSDEAVKLAKRNLTKARKKEIALKDPTYIREFSSIESGFFDELPYQIRTELCVETSDNDGHTQDLAEFVTKSGSLNKLRNELSILEFAREFCRVYKKREIYDIILPAHVVLKLDNDSNFKKINRLAIPENEINYSTSLYSIPKWVEPKDRWRYHLGFLLRFVLSGQPDFTRIVRKSHWRESLGVYRPAESHWYQRIYGLFSGQPAFGDDWVPISQWLENLLFSMLRWPGSRARQDFDWVEDGIEKAELEIRKRISILKEERGNRKGMLMIPIHMERIGIQNNQSESCANRSFRACVVQTVFPTDIDFTNCSDLTLSSSQDRRKHRRHLSAALAAVRSMLRLRKTHLQAQDYHLDLLVLPELAVHHRDVKTHLIPFARQHKTLILTGLTYEELFHGQPLVNSALWIVPVLSHQYGLQIQILRQGKLNLAGNENQTRIQGFRPCQWLIHYQWSCSHKPLSLTAAVCYDATDLQLTAELRDKSDIFIIPALNSDVKTFDNMALALHYHMYQLVVIANNGKYGGSSAYWPVHGEYEKQIFHTHGQPQASVSFLEIEDIADFLSRHTPRLLHQSTRPIWKYPPASS